MKKQGILNHQIMLAISTMGHTDTLVIADAGLPIPPDVVRIDLALIPGVPGFVETLRAVLEELQVEGAVVASEMKEKNPAVADAVHGLLNGVSVEEVPHERLKELTGKAVAVIRTGECTPYANVILRSGVTF
ncbi:MAG: D-ribose pyranase [Bacillota bacterium]